MRCNCGCTRRRALVSIEDDDDDQHMFLVKICIQRIITHYYDKVIPKRVIRGYREATTPTTSTFTHRNGEEEDKEEGGS